MMCDNLKSNTTANKMLAGETPGGIVIAQVQALPVDLPLLATQATNEGFWFIDRLAADFASGQNRFSQPGEAFFTARDQDLLVGVGGLNRDPYTKDATQGRVRRLYVAPAYRRHGVARRLMTAIESAARPVFSRLRLRTDTLAAARFYEQLGYSRIDESGGDGQATHTKRL